jgi:ABC-type nitrate/sulfonate/bicarbonate transport system substrate-binding protein
MLIATLAKMGLTQNDVNIIHMDVSQAYTAFKAGQGDIVALWDPQSYNAENEDWVKVSSGEATGESMPTVIVASEKAIKEKPQEIKTWLQTYFETCDKYREDIAGQSKYLLTMQLDNGIDTTQELATRFCNDRELPSLEKNIELFTGEYGQRPIDATMEKIIDFFVNQGSITDKDKQTLIDNNFIDSTFIDMLAEEK